MRHTVDRQAGYHGPNHTTVTTRNKDARAAQWMGCVDMHGSAGTSGPTPGALCAQGVPLDMPVDGCDHPRQPETEIDVDGVAARDVADGVVGGAVAERCRLGRKRIGQTRAQRDKRDGGDAIAQANDAAKQPREVANDGRDDANVPQRKHKGGPPAHEKRGRDGGHEYVPRQHQHVNEFSRARDVAVPHDGTFDVLKVVVACQLEAVEVNVELLGDCVHQILHHIIVDDRHLTPCVLSQTLGATDGVGQLQSECLRLFKSLIVDDGNADAFFQLPIGKRERAGDGLIVAFLHSRPVHDWHDQQRSERHHEHASHSTVRATSILVCCTPIRHDEGLEMGGRNTDIAPTRWETPHSQSPVPGLGGVIDGDGAFGAAVAHDNHLGNRVALQLLDLLLVARQHAGMVVVDDDNCGDCVGLRHIRLGVAALQIRDGNREGLVILFNVVIQNANVNRLLRFIFLERESSALGHKIFARFCLTLLCGVCHQALVAFESGCLVHDEADRACVLHHAGVHVAKANAEAGQFRGRRLVL
eukprot:m.211705 g.211705  ORF g.211705 m.211705 type:complete len:529 (+) comp19030_c0_seq16:439-2025(+)